MGGYESGRYGGRPTAEACASYILDAQSLNRARLRDGVQGTVSLTYRDGFTVVVTVDTTNPAGPFVELAHEWHTAGAEQERYRVYLNRTPRRSAACAGGSTARTQAGA